MRRSIILFIDVSLLGESQRLRTSLRCHGRPSSSRTDDKGGNGKLHGGNITLVFVGVRNQSDVKDLRYVVVKTVHCTMYK